MTDVIAIITQRRRQLFVHSVIYYRLGTSIIDDAVFDRWGRGLRDLQRDFPVESVAAPMAYEFADWDGTTGFHLTERADYETNEWALRKAAELIETYENMTKE